MESSSEETTPKLLWKKAAFVASHTAAFSKSFHTLRDMVPDVFIDPSELNYVKSLGEGAFASVGLCTVNGRTVAVKYLKPSLLQSDRDLNDFLKEAALLKKLSHHAVVNFVGVAIEMETPVGSKSQRGLVRRSLTFGDKLKTVKSRMKLKRAMTAIEQKLPEENPEDESPEFPTLARKMSVPLRNVMIVQEFMSRGTLKCLLLKQMEHPLKLIYTRQEALEWLIQLAEGLKYLHEAKPKIIHRDLKLENLMLTIDAQEKVVAKLADFGLHAVLKEPRHIYEQEPSETQDISETLSSGQSLSKIGKCNSVKASYELSGRTGSLMYMAPEVLRYQPYNEKADVFSFALIMYELFWKSILLCFVSCTGQPEEIEQYAQGIARGRRPAVPDDWPDELKSLVRQCWSHHCHQRPSMADVVIRLKQLRELDWMSQDQSRRRVKCTPQ